MAIKILLADDSLTIQKVVELTFSDAETRLMAVGSGDRAVQALDDFAPDIVLADVVMPGRTGYDVCEAVKQRPGGAFVPVVLLTGTFEPFDRARAEKVGSDAIVTKPFDSHALQGLVRELVEKARSARLEAEANAAAAPPPALEPPPTTILTADDFEAVFPVSAVPAEDTGATQAMPALDLGGDFATGPMVPPAAESGVDANYRTMAMRIPTPEELARAAEEEGILPPPPALETEPEAAPAPETVSPFEMEPEVPAPPAIAEDAFAPPAPPPPAVDEALAAAATEAPYPFDVEPAPETVPPPPGPMVEAEAVSETSRPVSLLLEDEAVVPPEAPVPVFLETELAPVAEATSPFETETAPQPELVTAVLPEAEAGQDTEPLAPIEAVPEEGAEPFFAEVEPEPPVETVLSAEPPFETAPEPVAGPGSGEIEVEYEAAPAAVATPSESDVVEPFPEMDEPVPVEDAAPWDEGPGVEIPPPPPELAAGAPEGEDAEPMPRDIEADLEAFEASGRVRRRPEIWERHAALIGEETPPDVDLTGAETQEEAGETELEPLADREALPAELEEIAAAARLEDLSKLIPSPPPPAQQPEALPAVGETPRDLEPAATTAPIAPPAPGSLSDGDVDRIARRVVEMLSDKVVRDIAWEVVPEYAERLVRERISEVERAG